MNDAHIARGWAERAMNRDLLDDVPIEGYRSAARYILATTTPPTMADIEWDDSVHAGLCASVPGGSLVRMVCLAGDTGAVHVISDSVQPSVRLLSELTPIPGTRLDLTPRRVDSDEAPSTRYESVPRPVLTTEADYRNAPAGTVAATEGEGALTWTKGRDGFWEAYGSIARCSNDEMPTASRRVLRWGWSA